MHCAPSGTDLPREDECTTHIEDENYIQSIIEFEHPTVEPKIEVTMTEEALETPNLPTDHGYTAHVESGPTSIHGAVDVFEEPKIEITMTEEAARSVENSADPLRVGRLGTIAAGSQCAPFAESNTGPIGISDKM